MANGMLSMSWVENAFLMLNKDHGDKRFTFIFYKPKIIRRKNLGDITAVNAERNREKREKRALHTIVAYLLVLRRKWQYMHTAMEHKLQLIA